MSKKIAGMRLDYHSSTLEMENTAAHPMEQFGQWFEAACAGEEREPNAMVLSTSNAEGQPAARVLLLKGFDADGFYFYTNYQSRKAMEMGVNPKVAMTFNWLTKEQQIRISGKVEKASENRSNGYYASRPKGSRLGAWVSPQSQTIRGRSELDERLEAVQRYFEGEEDIPRPPFWGGYLLRPERVEFWQGRPSRLHDRIVYVLEHDEWRRKRLAP